MAQAAETSQSTLAAQWQHDDAVVAENWNDTDGSNLAMDDLSGPFEGPEKLLELWFAASAEQLPEVVQRGGLRHYKEGARIGLRRVPRSTWESMLEIVKCKTLSVLSGADADAYLLSESSMFVYPHKLVLKTCGTTTLLLGLERLLRIAKAALFDEDALAHSAASVSSAVLSQAVTTGELDSKLLGSYVQRCFYSRKSFMFPDRQQGPHRDWVLETELLDRFFDNGAAYTVGRMNGDHWLLYLASSSGEEPSGSLTPSLPPPAPSVPPSGSDMTLELLMTELAPEACQKFHFTFQQDAAAERDVGQLGSALCQGHVHAYTLSERIGLSSLFDETQLDAFAFEPCGYSANALVPASAHHSDGYWTVHVTPEQGSSYASFETNVAMDCAAAPASADQPAAGLQDVVLRVVNIFRPGSFTLTLFVSVGHDEEQRGEDAADHSVQALRALRIPHYRKTERIAYEFDGYDLLFFSFQRVA